MLNRRQIDVQHRNLSSMCRITVKSLIDYACVNTHVDEDCEEFVNFCAVFEQMVSHRMRPYQKKVWHRGQGAPRHFWEVMLDNHRQGPLFRSCIPNIEAIENIKSPRAKLRAFVRVALMEKRLSDYLYWLQNNRSLMSDCYYDGALFLSEDGVELVGDIIGLSAIDFNFCLKGNENELLGPFEISYAPFLNYTQSSASRLIDEEEMLQLSGKSPVIPEPFNEDRIKLQSLEVDYRRAREQKDYLEELVRLRERQMGEASMRLEEMRQSVRIMEIDWESQKRTLDGCILELQDEITNLRVHNGLMKMQISELQLFKSNMEYKDVPMVDMAYVPVNSLVQGEDSEEKKEDRPESVALLPIQDSASQMSSDQRSIISGISDQIRLKEDSQSLIPLTGSLADVNIAMIRDNQQGEESKGQSKKTSSGSSKDQREGCEDVELTLFETNKEESESATTTNAVPAEAPILEISSTVTHSVPTSPTSSSASATATQDPSNSNEAARSPLEDSYVVADVETEKDLSGPEGDNEKAELITKDDVVKSENQAPEKESEDKSSLLSSAAVDVSQALQDLGKAFDTDDPERSSSDPLQVSTDSNNSNGDSSGNGQDDANTSSLSEPEILDKVNISSEGSDAAWEMLSDAEDTESNNNTNAM